MKSHPRLLIASGCAALLVTALACNLPLGDGTTPTEETVGGGATSTPITPVPPTWTVSPTPTLTPATGCSVPDPNVTLDTEDDPYYHALYRADSDDDGATFTAQDDLLLDHASAPDAVLRSDGEVWVYYVNGLPGNRDIWAARLTDGGMLEHLDCIKLDGAATSSAVNPDASLLPDGRIRLYYQANFGVEGPDVIRGATSEDGINFTVEGDALSLDGATHPTVTRLADGRWLLAVAAGDDIRFAISDDGSSFGLTTTSLPRNGGLPELVTLADGSWLLFYVAVDTTKPPIPTVPTLPGLTGTPSGTPDLILTLTSTIPTLLPDVTIPGVTLPAPP